MKLHTNNMSDFVQVKVSVPKGLAEFVRNLTQLGGSEITIEDFLVGESLEGAKAIIDAIPEDQYTDHKTMLERYGLEEKEVN